MISLDEKQVVQYEWDVLAVKDRVQPQLEDP